MEFYNRPVIDYVKTGERLANLRFNNLKLRRYVCYYNKKKYEKKIEAESKKIRYGYYGNSQTIRPKYNCFSNYECEKCTKELDKLISAQELANVFGVSRDIINNWETGKTSPDIEDFLLYSKITGLDLNEIIVFEVEIWLISSWIYCFGSNVFNNNLWYLIGVRRNENDVW